MLARRISLPAALAAILGAALVVGGCAKPSGGGDTGSGGTTGTGKGGTTGVTCASGQKACSQGCTNVQTDPQNCGACGTACGTGQTCSAGVCACGTGLLSCGGSCVSSNNANCGTCGATCSSTQVCSNNACSSSCATGTTACSGGTCANTMTDPLNCGTCGTVCSGGSTCNAGACTCAVTTQKLCGGTCLDTTSNMSNCGSCGHACTTGQTCTNSVCTTVSTTGTAGTTGSGTAGNTGSGTAGSTGSGTAGSTGSGTAGTTGSTGTGGSSTITGDPPGYYKTADWNVTSVDWHGCVWTGKDSTVAGSTTSITPQDFTGAAKEGGPYEVSGTVYNDYNAVALLGFNLDEATTGSSTQCKYNAADATQAGPPAGTIPSGATGIAVNWSAKVAPPTSFRIQLQSADGATNPLDTWCATITDAQGPSFIPFTSFYQKCYYVGTTMSPGAQFMPGTNSVDAVAFLVPGTVGMTAPFDFTIVGFAPGTSKADAPGGAAACGVASGTIGSTTASEAASFQRAAVTGTDCKEYVVQNNNWGNPTGSTQVVNYTGNGFTVQSSSGSTNSNNGQPVGAPASFPSTFVGANGNIAGGTYNTWSDTGLPKQISAMQSVMTSFNWSGGKSNGDYNATYDVWFASAPPTPGYADGVSGFLMVWLYKPGGRTPIGNTRSRTASIADSAGTMHMFDVYVGPRGSTATGTGPASRPVVSYVAQSTLSSLSFDLKKFINDAVTNADTNNGVTGPFSSTWYLTDVFAGFEIWTGSDGVGLKSTGFSVAVK
jgi:Glycosyl hydrolase family 12